MRACFDRMKVSKRLQKLPPHGASSGTWYQKGTKDRGRLAYLMQDIVKEARSGPCVLSRRAAAEEPFGNETGMPGEMPTPESEFVSQQ
jgi:hypothetical protein